MTKGRHQMPVALLSNLINDGLAVFQCQYFHRYMDELRNWSDTDETEKRYTEGLVLRSETNAALYFAEFHRCKPYLDICKAWEQTNYFLKLAGHYSDNWCT